MTTVRASGRAGFSLIELLIVIGILALLAALATAAAFRVTASQRVNATEATVSKLAALLEKKRSAVADAIRREKENGSIPADILSYAGSDPDRAHTIWTYLRFKQEFPTTRAEATTPVTAFGSTTVTGPPVRKVFAAPALPTGTYHPTFGEAYESAACLYLILTATGTSGMTTDLEGLQNQTTTFTVGTTQVTAFADAWGKPIAFSRLTFAPELDTATYANTRAASKDPNDPLGKLGTPAGTAWTTSGSTNKLNDFWTEIRKYHLAAANAPTPYPTSPTRNTVFAVVSGGPDELFFNAATAVSVTNSLFGSGDESADNIVSFRLRAGMKGQ